MSSDPEPDAANGLDTGQEDHSSAVNDTAAPQAEAQSVHKCPVCAHPYRAGELACSNCGYVFSESGRTHRLDDPYEVTDRRNWPTGEVLVTDQRPIIFEINGKDLRLPIAEQITVGRVMGEDAPDVDLSPFGAEKQGVSRLHIRIRRKGVLLYVSDLGSTNGTLLNGRRLIPEGERLLRHGDELRLGRLKIRVRF